MPHEPLRVVARLASPLAGDPPFLDSLLVSVASRLAGKPATLEPGYKIDRRRPCPDSSGLPIGVSRQEAGGWKIAMATSPILGQVIDESHEYTAKRLAVEHAGMLAESERRVVATTNQWTKSYRLPVRCRRVDRIAWLCFGRRRDLIKNLKEVRAVGTNIAHGYGQVAEWLIEPWSGPSHRYWPWWVGSDRGPVLMRPLPASWAGLPSGLIGARQDFGACVDPYWHPERFGEVVVPC